MSYPNSTNSKIGRIKHILLSCLKAWVYGHCQTYKDYSEMTGALQFYKYFCVVTVLDFSSNWTGRPIPIVLTSSSLQGQTSHATINALKNRYPCTKTMEKVHNSLQDTLMSMRSSSSLYTDA